MNADENGYNGWTNYETWNMNLWISNDQGLDDYAREQAQFAWDESDRDPHRFIADGIQTRERAAVHGLAERLKAWQESEMPELPTSTWSDLLNAAFGEINWTEIAEHYIEDVDKGDEGKAQ